MFKPDMLHKLLPSHSPATANFSPVAASITRSNFGTPPAATSCARLKGHDGTVFTVAFSPDDKLIASGSADNSAKIWDVATGTVKQTLRGHSLYVSSVQFSPDGRLVGQRSADQQVKIWDVITGQEIRTLLPNIDPKYSIGLRVLFTRDGKTLITAGEVIKFWDVASGKLLRTIKIEDTGPIPVIPIALSPDSKVLATASNTIKLWDVVNGKLVANDCVQSRLAFLQQRRTNARGHLAD